MQSVKRKYNKPDFKEVIIDIEITLVMMSDPSPGPGENSYNDDKKEDDAIKSPFEE